MEFIGNKMGNQKYLNCLMLMYPEHLRKRVDFGQALLVFLILAQRFT